MQDEDQVEIETLLSRHISNLQHPTQERWQMSQPRPEDKRQGRR